MRVGVDIGGTKLEAIVMRPGGETVLRKRVPTPQGDYEGTLRAVAGLVQGLEATLGISGLPTGVGLPGSVSPRTGLVRNANSVCLNGRPFAADLSKLLDRPIASENDANCMALSEARDGAAKGAGSVLGVIIGTGCGAGFVLNGQIWGGANGIASEIGHNPLSGHDPAKAPLCFCGRRGCAELYVSGTGLARDHVAVNGEDAAQDAALIAAQAQSGDPAAQATLARHLRRLGRYLGQVVNILDPEVIVLGGGLSNLPGLAQALPNAMRPHIFADHIDLRVVCAQHGDSSGVRGAAFLASEGSNE